MNTDNNDGKITNNTKIKINKPKKVLNILKPFLNESDVILDIGVDEAGRGPLFGRVYASAVILPKDDTFSHNLIKDSKKFTSKNKINEAYNYIKEYAIAWAVEYEDEKVVDEINILQATQSAMHKCITNIINQLINKNMHNMYSTFLLIDGNYFKPYKLTNNNKNEIMPYKTIEGGDNKYTPIAAASILAKVDRDKYIEDLCIKQPQLITYYSLDSNKGYGAKKHIEGIKKYGITIWHRKTFGICKQFTI